MHIIKNGLVYFDHKFHNVDIAFKKNTILKIATNINAHEFLGAKIIDANNKIITPNFTDVHVHFRYPGQTHKEDLITGVASAINGGYTTVIMMPNTNPVIDNQKTLDLVRDIANDQLINLKTYIAATKGQKGVNNTNYSLFLDDDFVAGFSDDGHGIIDDAIMEKVIIESAKHNFIVSIHLQDNKYATYHGKTSKQWGLMECTIKAEYKQAQRDISLISKNLDAKYHISHISTKQTLQIVKAAKLKGLNISCEVTPHHLLHTSKKVSNNNGNWKMNPPLRKKQDCDELIEGLNLGIIEIIATDHAPHTKKEKQNGSTAPFGVIGLDTCFASLYTYLVKTNRVKLETIIEAMSHKPNKIFNLNDASIREGNEANFNIIDLQTNFIVDENFIKSKSKNNPFLNHKLFGKITHVFFKGKNLKESRGIYD